MNLVQSIRRRLFDVISGFHGFVLIVHSPWKEDRQATLVIDNAVVAEH